MSNFAADIACGLLAKGRDPVTADRKNDGQSPEERHRDALADLDRQIDYLAKASPLPWHIGNAVDPTRLCNVHSAQDGRSVADSVGWLDAEVIVAAVNGFLTQLEGRKRTLRRHAPRPSDGRCTMCRWPNGETAHFPCPDWRDAAGRKPS